LVSAALVSDPETRAYVERRTKDGKSKREIMAFSLFPSLSRANSDW
jgi:hypothetical protein